MCLLLLCVCFSFFNAKPRDWLRRSSPLRSILYQVGCKTITHSLIPWQNGHAELASVVIRVNGIILRLIRKNAKTVPNWNDNMCTCVWRARVCVHWQKKYEFRPGKVSVNHSRLFGAATQQRHIKQPQRLLKITYIPQHTEWATSFSTLSRPQLLITNENNAAYETTFERAIRSVWNDTVTIITHFPFLSYTTTLNSTI